MSAERKARLESLEWWAWSVRATPVRLGWDARYDGLVAYHAEHGTLPPKTTPGGLGTWVETQRSKRATIDADRKERLEALESVASVRSHLVEAQQTVHASSASFRLL